MKAATGETTLTIITIVAVGAILVFFGVWWSKRQADMNKDWGKDASSQINTNTGNIK